MKSKSRVSKVRRFEWYYLYITRPTIEEVSGVISKWTKTLSIPNVASGWIYNLG